MPCPAAYKTRDVIISVTSFGSLIGHLNLPIEVQMPNGQDAPPNQTGDSEIKAMNAIVDALKPLTEEERRRVLEYVLGRFGATHIATTRTEVLTFKGYTDAVLVSCPSGS
jgi:hypothetical protein